MAINKHDNLLFPGILAILLVFPSFFINLGITPVIEDEAIRSLDHNRQSC
jgi:hypothetical protein